MKEFIKDVSQFDRDPKKTLLLDSKPLNFILNPDNVIPCVSYSAESDFSGEEKDNFLELLMKELEDFKG